MQEQAHAIHAEGLRKVFPVGRGGVVEAVRGVSFSVSRGEIFGILGPNGAGKTTLLRMLGTIIPPTSGRCWVAGESIEEQPDAVRRRVGFLSGNTRLYSRLTCRELLLYFGQLYGLSRDTIAQRTGLLVDLLDMGEFEDRRCGTLSSGQEQKVSIARVMLHDPEVLILDEPTVGLDIMTSTTILDFIAETKTRGRTVVFSTHYMTEAELLCDRIALIHRGELLALGTLDELRAETGTSNLKDAFLALVDRRKVAAP